jgi:hypothetical protein
MFKFITKLLKINKPKVEEKSVTTVYVTIDWSGNPITTKGDGKIYPRKVEMILNDKYYPTKTIGEWPCDPDTGEKLPMIPYKKN